MRCLDLLVIKKALNQREQTHGKELLEKIVAMLVGLIRSNSTDRLHEESVTYRVGREKV